MTVQIAGKYCFSSQENFEEFLKADNAGMIMRNVVAAEKPDVIIEIDGNNYKITTCTKLKTYRKNFTLGQAYEYDSEYKRIRCVTTLEGGDTLFSKNMDDASTSSIKFAENGMIITMTTNGVTATRTFKRA